MYTDLDENVNHRIATVAGLLKRQVHRIIAEKDFNITPDQWTILNYLWDAEGLTIGELVERSKKDFSNVTRIVEKLLKQGYVTKAKHAGDGRSFIVYYTEKAMEIKSGIEECQKRSTEISLKNISQREQVAILNVLDKIEENTLSYLAESKPEK